MIDIEFDFSKEAKGKDPDRYSPTLIKYHRMLWQKPIKNNKLFNLTFSDKNRLKHSSDLGVFELSSDTIGHTYRKWKSMSHIIKQIPQKEIELFLKTCRTFGGYIIFPANQINGKDTINQARGKKRKRISDRWDLTVECIRRHYKGGESPLSNVLARYSSFFNLFENFKGYIEFFHLQDIVSDDFENVEFYLPFDNFKRVPRPQTKEEYLEYMQAVMLFIQQRNTRILIATNY